MDYVNQGNMLRNPTDETATRWLRAWGLNKPDQTAELIKQFTLLYRIGTVMIEGHEIEWENDGVVTLWHRER